MVSPNFLTVPEELLEYAERAFRYFQDRGYKVSVEYLEPGYPNRPTLVCKRQGTTLFVEVSNSVSRRKLEEWVRYASSCNSDTQVALCRPESKALSGAEMSLLQDLKVGLYVASSDTVIEKMVPLDLALKMFLPENRSLPRKVRGLLGPVYDQMNRGQWREAFKDATQILEEQARRYLKTGAFSPTPRLVVLDKSGKPMALTRKKVDKMTLGQLAESFRMIQKPNSADALIAQALGHVNPDRVNLTHHKAKRSTERKLRANVGKHMWAIIAALKEMCKR